MSTNNRRRKVVVDGFQARFVMTQLLWVVIGLLVFAAALLGPPMYSLLNAGSTASRAVADEFLWLHRIVWPLLIGLTAMLAAVFVRMSHRVAGPLYRFRRAFKDIGEGRLDSLVALRPGDYLEEERDAINGMVGELRNRVRSSQEAAAELDAFLAERTARGCPLSAEGMDTLRQHLGKVRASLGEFVVGGSGFSLVEILIVVSIVTLITGLSVPAYMLALESARVTKAVGDMEAIDTDVNAFRLREGCMPSSLADIGKDTLQDPWGNPYQYGVIGKAPGGSAMLRSPDPYGSGGFRIVHAVYDSSRGPVRLLLVQGTVTDGSTATCKACSGVCLTPGAVRKDRRLVPINSDFDLYSTGKDGLSNSPLTSAHSLDDVIRADNGGFYGLAKTY